MARYCFGLSASKVLKPSAVVLLALLSCVLFTTKVLVVLIRPRFSLGLKKLVLSSGVPSLS